MCFVIKKYHILIILPLFFTLLLYSQDVQAYQNEPDGFRGIKWGTSIEEIKNNGIVLQYNEKLSKEFPGIDIYDSLNDEMSMNGQKTSRICYYFKNNSLISVDVDFKENTDQIYVTVLRSTIAKFGEPNETNDSLTFAKWSGNTTITFFRASAVITINIYNTIPYEKAMSETFKILDEQDKLTTDTSGW